MIPMNYSELNKLEGMYTPSTVKRNSEAFWFWIRALFERATSVIEFDGLPDEWTRVQNRFYSWLFGNGYIAVTKLNEVGLVFNKCSLSGFDFYYEPTRAIIANPALPTSRELTVGKDCAIVRLSPDYMGVVDILVHYAEKLALLDSAQNTSLINSKNPFLLGAKNKAAAAAIAKMLDQINSGEPFAIFDTIVADNAQTKDSPFHFFKLFEGKDYITDKLLRDTATILNQFDAEIGIKTVPYQKAERMVTSEADSKEEDSSARCTVWLRELNSSLSTVNELYGLNIRARRKEVEENGEVDNIRD